MEKNEESLPAGATEGPTMTDIEILVPFLRDLANQLENKSLVTRQVQKIGEFFMSYKFDEELERNNKEEDEISQADMMKFFFLGWHVYANLLKDKVDPTNSDKLNKNKKSL